MRFATFLSQSSLSLSSVDYVVRQQAAISLQPVDDDLQQPSSKSQQHLEQGLFEGQESARPRTCVTARH
jgi:hypothetical protein